MRNTKIVGRMISVPESAETSDHVTRESSFPYECQSIDESIAMATMTIAEHLSDVKAVISLAATRNTPKLMSRSLSHLPISALANNYPTLARVALFRSVLSKGEYRDVKGGTNTMKILEVI